FICSIHEILAHCHSGPTRGHHSASITERKVYESGFFWPSIFKDAKDYVMRCEACQISRNISSRSEMPQNNIQVEAQALPMNDALVVINFFRGLFSRFGVPKALISAYVCVYVDYVGVGTQSIERDCLIEIGVVLDNSFRSLLSDGEMIIKI
ncbi:reverse transcriptase domain-containing protein, partial [Tanacetum coccineum]